MAIHEIVKLAEVRLLDRLRESGGCIAWVELRTLGSVFHDSHLRWTVLSNLETAGLIHISESSRICLTS